jgi:nitrate/TMAO reductase-like tetraheme cytochrome c subunit
MRVHHLAGVAVLVACVTLFVLPVGALAQEVPVTISGEAGGYDVDFTLPTAAKSGCLVCHGDENLIRLREDEVVSFFVDPAQLEAGPHATVQCAGCHLDFAFTLPHVQSTGDWQSTAKSACKNCHQDQYVEFGQGVHRPDVGNGESAEADEKPLCGDCHGSHDIVALVDSPDGQRAMRDNAYEICGRCHQDYWDNYDDYYHGRGFKTGGAYDAPSCWDCHGYHDIRPSDDRLSMVHESRLAETCTSGDACHDDVNDGYLDYVDLIHGQREAYAQNPLLAIFNSIRSAIAGLFGG